MPRDDKSEAFRRGASEIIGYEDFLTELKIRISSAQLRAVVAVNKELVLLYWQIGRDILNRQQQQGWGAKNARMYSNAEEKIFNLQVAVDAVKTIHTTLDYYMFASTSRDRLLGKL